MKKQLIVLFLLITLITQGSPSFFYASKGESALKSERGFIHKENPLLSRVAKILKKKKNRVVLVDGERTTSAKLKKSAEVHQAVREGAPVIISQPTKAQLQSITGFGIASCEAAVVIPKRCGEECVIYIVGGTKRSPKGIRALQHGGEDLDAQVHMIKSIIDESQVERSIVKESASGGNSHKRWTVLYAEPYFWGKSWQFQGQFMDVGFQFDLYNVVDPAQRKYLTVQTVGKGVSAGALRSDTRFHRGFFQSQVSVAVKDIGYEHWEGEHLRLERYAPESDNCTNTATVTTGATFTLAALPGLTFTGMPYVNNYSGFALNYAKGETSSFHDFTVNFDPVRPTSPSTVQWTYWLSGANGAKIRKKHQAYDLVEYTGIRELPQLAKESVLMPHMECVYYADGEENGVVSILGTVGQKLMEIKNYVVTHETKQIEDHVDHLFSVDFSQVHS